MVADNMGKLLYEKLSYDIIGCIYEVYNDLGPAHKEQVYHNALKIMFDSKNIQYKDEPRLKIKFKGKDVGTYVPDFIVEDKIVIELKSTLTMPMVFEKQLYYYLRGTKYKVGYLVNFGSDKLEIRRRVYETLRENPRGSAFDPRQSALNKT